VTTEAHSAPREYRWHMPAGWWTRRRNYFFYMLREFTALPMALWLLWLLVDIKRAGNGAAGYRPASSTLFVVFSVVVLAFALYHSITFLSLSGLIIRIKLFDRPVPARLITAAMFGAWFVASAIVAAVLIGFAR
jgi:fumarate reductase subunit C